MTQERRYASYVREKLGRTRSVLREQDRPIQERLQLAHRFGISAIPIDWIPEADARGEFAAIVAELSRYGEAFEGAGSVRTTLWTMSDEEATALSERILAFADGYLT